VKNEDAGGKLSYKVWGYLNARDEDPDTLIFGTPDPDPTCNNRFIKLFS